MGWLLWAISNDSTLRNSLILKGSNCLRKIYFPDTRFSDDLDFTTCSIDSESVFAERLRKVCDMVTDSTGIVFDNNRLIVRQKDTPDKDCKALDGRVYFSGFAGEASVAMRVKFDVSEYEKIVLPTPRLPIIHDYNDADACRCDVLTYALEEVLAEKLRSWIQRTRARDLFDAVKILQSDAIPISKSRILSVFIQKTIFKGILAAGRDEMLVQSKFEMIQKSWLATIICPANAFIAAANAVAFFRDFVNALFEPEVLSAIGASIVPSRAYGYNINSGIREAIVQAGRARHLLRMRYHGVDRDIEPYSFRYKTTKKGISGEYFYGYDRTRDNTIKSFFLNEVQNAAVLAEEFLPRWLVEF